MLVLTRKIGETVVVGDDTRFGPVRVTVVSVKGGRVRLGFAAPTEVPIHREEVSLAMRRKACSHAAANQQTEA